MLHMDEPQKHHERKADTKTGYCIISFIWNVQKGKFIHTVSRSVVVWGWGGSRHWLQKNWAWGELLGWRKCFKTGLRLRNYISTKNQWTVHSEWRNFMVSYISIKLKKMWSYCCTTTDVSRTPQQRRKGQPTNFACVSGAEAKDREGRPGRKEYTNLFPQQISIVYSVLGAWEQIRSRAYTCKTPMVKGR